MTNSQSTFQTGGGNNLNGYSNKASDADYQKLQSEYSQPAQLKLLADVDKNAWSDAYGVTLFQFPDISAWSSNVQNLKDNPLSPGIFWNYFDWTIKKPTK